MKTKITLLLFFITNQIVHSQTDPRDFRGGPSLEDILSGITILIIWMVYKSFKKETEDEKNDKLEKETQQRKKKQKEEIRRIDREKQIEQDEEINKENKKKYYELLRKYYWNENLNDWLNPNNEITLDLLLINFPNSTALNNCKTIQKEKYYNFDELWMSFPVSDQHGNWLRTRTLKSNKTDCEKLYNRQIQLGVKHEYILISLKFEMNQRIKNSTLENKLSFMKNSSTWLYQFEVNWDSVLLYDLNRLLKSDLLLGNIQKN